MSLGESDVHLYASIGIATGLSSSPAVLLRDADLALYVAKTNGKHRVEVVAPEMRTSATQQLALAAGLRQALQRRELEVYYQPIVDARDGAPRGAEALLRWRHPTRGIVAPTEFIPVAESEEMIREIGESVLHRACRQAADWRRRHVVDDSFTISVNVSPLQLASPDFPDRVRSALRDSGLPPHVLMLELTESALMLSFAAGQRVLQALRDTGTKLALDDFGTGYSSLRRLRNLPVQELKIDKAFVEHLGHSSEDDAVAAGIVALAHSFGASTVAEGVETEQQARRLRELGCDLLQGFLFALPQPPGDAEAALIQLAERSRGLTGSTMATGGDPVAQASA
jgi:EAL domain-containing protein (putative c-di-GMP-specific phosphodiesterase class I)